MKKRKLKKGAIVLLSALVGLFLFCFAFFLMYQDGLKGPSKDSTAIQFEVKEGSTYLTLASSLKEEGLIKNELFYQIYVRIHNPKDLQKGYYLLSKDMGVKKILSILGEGNTYNPDAVVLSVPEGKTIEEVAEITSGVISVSKEEILSVWDSESFVKEAIQKYWFLEDTVLDDRIRHPLEGYLFPSTYELQNKEVSAEYVAYKMLDQMEKVLNHYKEDILSSEYSPHELLTLASIVEYEAILDEDRADVAGVFYNRLMDGWKLQSCATLGYAINEWKLTYTQRDMDTDSPYNTYYYTGLPVGPGGMPSTKSIEAAIYPKENDYYYFMANVCDVTSKKTYFSKTLSEHEEKVRKYLTCF